MPVHNDEHKRQNSGFATSSTSLSWLLGKGRNITSVGLQINRLRGMKSVHLSYLPTCKMKNPTVVVIKRRLTIDRFLARRRTIQSTTRSVMQMLHARVHEQTAEVHTSNDARRDETKSKRRRPAAAAAAAVGCDRIAAAVACRGGHCDQCWPCSRAAGGGQSPGPVGRSVTPQRPIRRPARLTGDGESATDGRTDGRL